MVFDINVSYRGSREKKHCFQTLYNISLSLPHGKNDIQLLSLIEEDEWRSTINCNKGLVWEHIFVNNCWWTEKRGICFRFQISYQKPLKLVLTPINKNESPCKTPFRRIYMSIELLVLRMAVEEWQMVLAIFKIGLSKAVWTILNIPSQDCYLRKQLNYIREW